MTNEEADERAQTTGNSALDDMIAGYEADLDAEETTRLRKGDKEEGIDRDSSWVKRTRWVRHFGSRDKLEIFDAAEWVRARGAKDRRDDDEAARRELVLLERLGQSFDREVERYCWRLDSVPTETL